jgi:hypothetical protein
MHKKDFGTMNMTLQEKKDLVEVLSIIFQDSEFLMRAHAVNERTIHLTEELLHQLNFCNNATSSLLTSIQCFPKSKNVYGWLAGCITAIAKQFRMYKIKLKSNMFCSAHVISRFKSPLKETLL